MGVRTTNYIVVGVKFNYEDFEEDFLENVYSNDLDDNAYDEAIRSNDDGISIIADGMSGKYVVIGKILSKRCDGKGFKMTEISDNWSNDKVKENLADSIAKVTTKQFNPYGIRVYVFTHYS